MSNCVINHVIPMINAADTTVHCFGRDNTNTVSYKFNHQGFRSTVNFDTVPDYVFFGCSLVFGIGVADNLIFASQFPNSHNYGLAGHYNNRDIFSIIESFLKLNHANVKKVVCWSERNGELLAPYSEYLSQHNFIQFFCGPTQPFINCYPMMPQVDSDASGTHMGPGTHKIMHKLLCTIFKL